MSGNSSRHGGHQVAMKLIQTGLPLSDERSIVPPPTCGTTSAGAGSPTWNPAPEGALAAAALGRDGAVSDAPDVGPVELATGAIVGAGVGAAPGSGARASNPISRMAATPTP